MSAPRVRRQLYSSPLVLPVACLLLGLGIASGQAPSTAPEGPLERRDEGGATEAGAAEAESMDFEARWAEVERLVAEDKFKAAWRQVEDIRDKARASGDEDNWARALIEAVKLRSALHGFETALRDLHEQPWPEAEVLRVGLQLYYAHSLVAYLRVYSWEVGQRERVETGGKLDLERWTRDQIVGEVDRTYGEIWKERKSWGGELVDTLSRVLDPNDYPPHVRGTLRDAVTYLWVELLSDSSLWSPAHSNELHRLDAAALVAGDPQTSGSLRLADPTLHPLLKLGAVLDDLEDWHASNARPEAAFEARLERLRRLEGALRESPDRGLVVDNLRQSLARLDRRLEWWSIGQAELARMVRSGEAPDRLIRAREIALQGAEEHPGSIGALRCRRLVAEIEAPEYWLASMTSDGLRRRSIQVRHKNLETLFFRAYSVNLTTQLENSQDYNLLPVHHEVLELLGSGEPAASWRVELPPTPDYRMHQTFVVPPLDRPGLHVVVASARADFEELENRRAAVNLILGDLVLLTRRSTEGVEVTVRSGASGERLAGVEVSLYRFDYRQGHRRTVARFTDDAGRASFALPARGGRHHFLVARQGNQVALDPGYLRPPEPIRQAERSAALIYTDRSIYRPGQRIRWKAVAYRGVAEEGRFRTLPGAEIKVELLDANGEVVESKAKRTNDFGSAADEFAVPAGRLLGNWQLQTSIGGSASVRVEEYKRPTFEVTLDEPSDPLRLNRSATLSGRVRYYFGLPVTSGSVGWQVERVPVIPRWWFGFWPRPPEQAQIVAAGTSDLDEEGQFTLEFLPDADERLAATQGLTYRYRVSVDVTDEGGETRSASRSYRVGFTTVETQVESDRSFYRPGETVALAFERRDLNGVPRAGQADWHLTKLQPPAKTPLPADLPVVQNPADEEYAVPGDHLRPRWSQDYRPLEVLGSWEEGAAVQRGRLEHDEEGHAELALRGLEAGAYRLHYTTRDEFGAAFETRRELVIVGEGGPSLALPAILLVEQTPVSVGDTVRLFVHSGLPDQEMVLEIFRDGRRLEERHLRSRRPGQILEIPVTSSQRGGFGVALTLVRDHQWIRLTEAVFVPWEDRELRLEFTSFRDHLRPGATETWKVTVSGNEGKRLAAGSAEVLAYMYDRSLDLFAPHEPPSPLSLYPTRTGVEPLQTSLGSAGAVWRHEESWVELPPYPKLSGDRLRLYEGYGIGGPGRVGGPRVTDAVFEMAAQPATAAALPQEEASRKGEEVPGEAEVATAARPADLELRTEFSETAFWHPQLRLGEDGAVAFEFTVPDSVTEWNVWAHAITSELRGGAVNSQSRSVKELLVRPYLPRFLREGDAAEIKVVINNAGERTLEGSVEFEILAADPEVSLLADFGVEEATARSRPFEVAAGGGTQLDYSIRVPPGVGVVTFRVVARSAELSDGEQRSVPVLPGRMHLSQSRFVTLRDADRRELVFADLAADDDPTRIDEQLVVSLDAQLFYSVLRALPYLVSYPYECTEQTLNRFLSTGIVASLYEDYPSVARMASEFAQRESRFETWDATDPNRQMALEETPWLEESRGGADTGEDLIDVLDPRIATAERRAALAKLENAQTSLGGFPWFPGGPPSPHMTLYLLTGLSRALEFGIEVPRDMVVKAWAYMHRHYVEEISRRQMESECCWETITLLGYALSSYPDDSWTGGVFAGVDRQKMLDYSFRHWRGHSPLLKSLLALTLQRAGREEEASLVFDSVMDSAKTTRDGGTFWAPENRAWLWYNDTIEGHSLALRALLELAPSDARRHGLVQWLLLNKQLNHWKSTRATAEVIYALVHYLQREGTLEAREEVVVRLGSRSRRFVFEPDEYTGGRNRIVVPGEEVDPETMSTIVVEKGTPGFLFASATWHFSTERLPAEARGDLFAVSRRYFKRVRGGDEWILQPIEEGATLAVGDQIEVQLSIRAKHAAEYVHLRDPRGAGFEPESMVSGHQWNLGIGWYEEIRDSGTNFFFDWLPAGEFTLKLRLRVAMAGVFRAAPATLQSMYAPEFSAYSSGAVLRVAQ